jgi:hypothetical protein
MKPKGTVLHIVTPHFQKHYNFKGISFTIHLLFYIGLNKIVFQNIFFQYTCRNI